MENWNTTVTRGKKKIRLSEYIVRKSRLGRNIGGIFQFISVHFIQFSFQFQVEF